MVTWNGALFRRLCAQAHAAGLLCAPSVGPGYDARLATLSEVVRPRNDGLTYDRMWKTALKANADLVTITSYNEWQEGTQIEPARVAVGRASYDGAWGKNGVAAQRAYLAATARWAERLRGVPTSVERGRQPAAVCDRHGIVVAEVVEDRQCELAEPLAPLGRRVGDLVEDEVERLARARPPRARRGRREARRSRAELLDDAVDTRRREQLVEERRDGDRRARPDELGRRRGRRLNAFTAGIPCTRNVAESPGFASTSTFARIDGAVARRDLLLEHGRQRTARAAPGGPEVDDDRAARASARSTSFSNVASVTSMLA